MAMNDSYEFKSELEIVETYNSYLNNQSPFTRYPLELLPIRRQIVEWVIFLCQNLSFKSETLYRAISVFDSYMSKCGMVSSINDVKLIAIACLSIASKLEELNCNFISFFTQNVLNEEGNVMYTEKDLATKEIDVLKALNFKTNKSTPLQFSSVFLQICFNSMGNSNQFAWLLNVHDQVLKQCIRQDCSAFSSPVEIAMFAMNESLKQIPLVQKALLTIYNTINHLTTRLTEEEQCFSQVAIINTSPIVNSS